MHGQTTQPTKVNFLRYISWVEQEYPRGGKEGGIDKLIESCIRQFKDEKSVNNDQRFVEIWLKYAALSAKPLEVFDFMFNNGLCTQKPDLFEAWAWYLESSNAVKKAESVFLKGIGAMTCPETRERLTVRQKQFQARVIRRLNGEEIPEEETEEEKRSALGQLRGHGKRAKVGSVRVGAAKLGGPGVMQVGTVAKQPLKTNNSQAAFKIFTDENAPAGGAGATSVGDNRHLPSKADTKENEMRAGPWTKAKVVKSSANIPLNSISQHAKPAFTVYEEPNLAQPTNTPQRKIMAAETRVLSTKKEQSWELRCPVALFEPADPSKRPMYCKDKVYQGTTEFSLEELRALRWTERNKQQEELSMIERRKAELREQEEAMARKMAEQEEAMARKMAEMERKMAEWQRMMTGGSEVLVKGSTGLMVTRPSLSEPQPEPASIPAVSRQPSLDTTANLLAANPLGGGGLQTRNKSITVTPTATPSPHALKNSVLSQPSPTVNTKEAMAAMVNLWSKPVGDEVDQDPQPLQESGNFAPASSAPFQIYTDSVDSVSATGSSNFEVFCDSGSSTAPTTQAAPAPFAIFCDENAAQPPVLKLPTINRRSRSESLNRHEDKENSPIGTDDEDRENHPPQGYVQPMAGARPKAGILQEARNIKSIPLDVQEKVLDEDERRQEQEMQNEVFKSPISKVKSVNKPEIPKPFGGNQTIMLPNEDDFERLAKMSSTPFTGKPSYQFENDENTCAVNILYKQVPELEEDEMRPPPVPEEPRMMDRLDTIVETSREYYKSSSSSSGGDTLREGLNNRSHWGNTGHTVLHSNTRVSEAGLSMARTPGQHLMATTASSVSGYLGDKSTNLTKSGVKDNKRELIASPAMVNSFEKRMKVLEKPQDEEVDGFDEPTGMFGDMMAELKKNINQKELENSMQASFLEDAREEIPPTPGYIQRSHLNMSGAANTTGAPRLDVTGVTKLSVTGAGPRLDMTGAGPRLDMTGAGPRLDMTGAGVTPSLDELDEPGLGVTAPPPLDMSGVQEDELSSKTANLSLDEAIDPFHPITQTNLLGSLLKPVTSIHGYIPLKGSMPSIRVRANVSLGEDVFYISECKGEGGYAKVYAAMRQDNDMDCTISGIDAVLKVQKPANDWEFYICTEVQRRMEDDLTACAFMAIPRNYVFSDGGIFVSYHQKFGTLLDIINIIKRAQVGKTCIEPMAIYFTIELLKMVEALHKIGIIHADLKADNLLLQVR